MLKIIVFSLYILVLLSIIFYDHVLKIIIRLGIKPAYKVVKIIDGTPYSCIVYNSKYKVTYIKNVTIELNNNTLGMMCFLTKKNAKDFKRIIGYKGNNLDIIKVKPLVLGRFPKSISGPPSSMNGSITWDEALNNFYTSPYSILLERKLIIPKGTICYKSIKVLDFIK